GLEEHKPTYPGEPQTATRGWTTQPRWGWGNLNRRTQGSRRRQPWVRSRQLIATLKGLRRRYERPKSDSGTRTQPRWGWRNINRRTQGSRRRQPWAGRRNPFGVVSPNSGLRIRTQNSELRTSSSPSLS